MIVVLKQDMIHNVVKVWWISVYLPVPLAPVMQCASREETAVKTSSVCKHCVWDMCIYTLMMVLFIVYVVELMVSDVYLDEDEETTTVCAVITGRWDSMEDNITVTLNFTDSQLAGI